MFKRRRERKEFLQQEADERRQREEEHPWFLGDDDGPELDIEAGVSARMAEPAKPPGKRRKAVKPPE